jgi:RNA-binding protein YhbY
MKIDTNNLVKVSTYAREKEVSPQWVRQLVKRGDIKMIDIDGSKFIIIKNS